MVDALPKGPTGKILRREIVIPDARASGEPRSRPRGEAPDVAAALDMLLVDAAVGPVRRFRPMQSFVGIGARLAGATRRGRSTERRPCARAGPDRGRIVGAGTRRT